MKTPPRKLGIAFIFSLMSVCSSYNAYAAPGTLATAPLFVATAVEPNVYFSYDDSGSMGWETIVQDGTDGTNGTVSGRPIIRGFSIEYYAPQWETDCNVMPPEALHADAWIFRNHHGNKNYYNPDETYIPWAGVDLNGDPLFSDADETDVPRDPYSGTTNTLDLTERVDYYLYPWGNCNGNTRHENIYYIPTYTIWDDTDNDGVIETTDGHTTVEITAGTDEMQNFANWFVYYRTREFAAKSGIGRVINNTDATRMGMEAFHGELIQDLATMTDPTNKFNLLRDFYDEGSGGGTPAHRTLSRVGDRFLETDDSAAILPADEGGECQQNFNILMTDGFWNSFVNPNVGNADASNNDDGGFDGDATESNDGGNYEDGWTNTLADMAMHYYETDLRGDLDNNVPVQNESSYATGESIPNHQHLVTYTIGFGLNGSLDSTLDPATTVGFNWPNPMDTENEERVDDLWHAAYNGRGQFLSASNPQELEASLNTAIADIAERTATAAAASVTSAQLTTESTVFLAEFNTNRWQGTIYAFGIADPLTGQLNAAPTWSAAEVLAARDLGVNPRVILTHNGTEETTFRWGNLSDAMKDDLRTNAAGGTDSDAIGEARLNYLRGSHIDEGTGNNFRERAILSTGNHTRMADIVNSGPVYVGKPSINWPDEFPVDNPGTPYSTYRTAQENRTPVVYVGANDGMLHGFDAENGRELVAYVPSNLFSTGSGEGLHYLTQQNYIHQYYNDLTPSVSDVYFGGSWHTVLIGGQRAGGRGYFALDVTNPDNFSEANVANIVMWEFTDEDLGYTYSNPQIGMMNDGTWVAIFGNGYNHTGTSNETGGEAQLFIVDISNGSIIKKITTNTGTTTARNGLATPALADLDGNGTIDRAYAGDLEGNMWAFDLSGSTTTSWVLADSSPLFTTDGARPITTKPSLSFHPSIFTVEEPDTDSNEPNIMVFFGSGQYLVDADKTSTYDNYFYGVWDKGDYGLARSNLVDQTITQTTTSAGTEFRILSQNGVDYTDATVYGWNINFPDTGERSVTDAAVRGDIVYFNSSVPTSDGCSSGGYGYRFGVDLASGGAPSRPVFDTNNDGEIDGSDTLGGSTSPPEQGAAERLNDLPTKNTFTDRVGYTGPNPFIVEQLPVPPEGRFSWQELFQ